MSQLATVSHPAIIEASDDATGASPFRPSIGGSTWSKSTKKHIQKVCNPTRFAAISRLKPSDRRYTRAWEEPAFQAPVSAATAEWLRLFILSRSDVHFLVRAGVCRLSLSIPARHLDRLSVVGHSWRAATSAGSPPRSGPFSRTSDWRWIGEHDSFGTAG